MRHRIGDFHLEATLRELANPRTGPGRLAAIGRDLAHDHDEALAQLDAAQRSLDIAHADPVEVDVARAALAEVREFSDFASSNYYTLRAAFIDVARITRCLHQHPPGAGADPQCAACRITAAIPVHIYTEAAQQGAQQ